LKKKVTIAEIAAEAGVSIPTVSKVLNQREDVAPDTRRRVEEVIQLRRYIPSRVARALGSGLNAQIDLVVPAFDSDYTLEIVRGIEDMLSSTNMRLVFNSTHDEALRERKWLNKIIDSSTDGALLLLPRAESAYLETIVQRGLPIVVIDDRGVLPPTIPSVAATNWIGGMTATEYLISLGHRRIAIICGPATYISTKARLAGYRTALENAGLPIDPELIRPGTFRPPAGYEQTCALLQLPDPPTAIFACSDEQATGVYRALYTHSKKIPDEISVIGFDDVRFSNLMCPALTTIRQPLFEMGRLATNMLLQQIRGKPLDSTRVELTTSLVIRESCTAPAS